MPPLTAPVTAPQGCSHLSEQVHPCPCERTLSIWNAIRGDVVGSWVTRAGVEGPAARGAPGTFASQGQAPFQSAEKDHRQRARPGPAPCFQRVQPGVFWRVDVGGGREVGPPSPRRLPLHPQPRNRPAPVRARPILASARFVPACLLPAAQADRTAGAAVHDVRHFLQPC